MKQAVAFIIPTRNRSSELKRLLESISRQTAAPDQIILVDSSDSPVDALCREFPGLPLDYQHVTHPSLTAQRNAGLRRLKNDIRLVCFLDDDMVFEEGAVGQMMAFWEKAGEDVGGAVFNIINEKPPTRLVHLKRIFSSGTKERGIVLRSGFNTLVCPADKTRFVQWIFGGGTVWRRKVFEEFLFDEWFDGDGFCEDLDFSYRVGKKYKLAVAAQAKVQHLSPSVGQRRNNFEFGVSQVCNRYYFVRKHPELSKPLCLWGSVGQMVENFVRGLATADKGYLVRAAGNGVGFWKLNEINRPFPRSREKIFLSGKTAGLNS